MRWLPLLLLLAGCAATPNPTDDDDATAAPDIELTDGTWALTLTELREDSCGGADSAKPGASLGTTAVTSDGDSFVMVDSDDQTFDCSRTGNAFECTARPWVDEGPFGPVLPDADLHRSGVRSGTITAPGAMALENVNSDACTGDHCDKVEAAGGFTFPCVYSFLADASL